MMNITVDLKRCEGFASCVVTAPELFDLDDERSVAVVLEPVDGGPRTRALALEAAASCPMNGAAATSTRSPRPSSVPPS